MGTQEYTDLLNYALALTGKHQEPCTEANVALSPRAVQEETE